jgi:hypothetical protein
MQDSGTKFLDRYTLFTFDTAPLCLGKTRSFKPSSSSFSGSAWQRSATDAARFRHIAKLLQKATRIVCAVARP